MITNSHAYEPRQSTLSFKAIELPKKYILQSVLKADELSDLFENLAPHKFKQGQSFWGRVKMYVLTEFDSVFENNLIKKLEQKGIKAKSVKNEIAQIRHDRFLNHLYDKLGENMFKN